MRKVVTTFAGCGGSSLGYVRAGGKVLLAVEWDENAVETYRLNNPGTDVYAGDIRELSIDEVFQRTGLAAGELDVLDGSPPCQGFSTAGKRRSEDPRNDLFREFVRLLRGLQPKIFVMENVSGMVKGKMLPIFQEIIRQLRDCGYKVVCRRLNAMYYGVPQSRERIIFIGVRNDLAVEPSHPKAVSRPITVAEAWKGVKNDEEEVAWLLKEGARGHGYKHYDKIPQGRGLNNVCGNRNVGFAAIKLHPNKPSNTVTAFNAYVLTYGLLHPTEQRRPTTAEFKRLCSFPDDYQFAGGWKDAVNRMGNAVPPKLAEAIAAHVFSLLDEAER